MTETNAYARAGVDIEAADTAIELMKGSVALATRPEVIGGLGGFAGLFDASALTRYTRPLLATSTDGVGTKVAIAQAMDVHDTIGRDLVGMVVDDLVVCGAEPLFMTDYIATGRVVPERIAAIVRGIAEGCAEAGCALVGGETAEHPGLLAPDEYDVAGATTGVVEADRLLGPARVRPGDVVLAMEASGLHSNGYSLVRHVLLGSAADGGAGWALDRDVPELGRTLGEELLEPTRIYAKACLDLAARTAVHAMSHVTGGGLAANLERVMPVELAATIDRATWTPPAGLRPGAPGRLGLPARPRGHAELRRRHGGAAARRRRRHRGVGAGRARRTRLGGRSGDRFGRPRWACRPGGPAPRLVKPGAPARAGCA